MHAKVLVFEPGGESLADLRRVIAAILGEAAEIETVADSDALLQRVRRDASLDLVVVPYDDSGHGGAAAAERLRSLRGCDAELPIVAVARRGDVKLAAEAVEAGATDFLVRGDRLEERVRTLLGKLRRIVALLRQNRALSEQNRQLRGTDAERFRLVGESSEIRAVRERIARVAAIPRPVLVVGERGTGKELVARAIHTASGRAEAPFIPVNCAAFPETLLETELFGHEKGAFTGADRLVPGKFEQASGGTLFLDEISHMPLAFQQKILRVVEYGTFARVGGTREVRVNVRVLAASNADLEQGIRDGWFLADLYDRLAFEVVRVPPLRERRGDVPILAMHFLQEFLREVPALGEKGFAADAMALLERYSFPGNLRELKTIIERAAYRDTTQEINIEDLALPRDPAGAAEGTFEERVAAYERQLVEDALGAAGGNQAEAARRLGLAYHRFRYYFHKSRTNISRRH
jgi:DNA-binding NtrC family response regulator